MRHAVHFCTIHDDDVDDLVSMGGLIDNLDKLGEALQYRAKGEVILVTSEDDGRVWILGEEGMGGGDQMISELLVLLGGGRGVEATHQHLFVYCSSLALLRPHNSPLNLQVMGHVHVQLVEAELSEISNDSCAAASLA